MVRSVVEENSTTSVKISKSMVKMVTLFLMQPRVYGQYAEENNESYQGEELNEKKTGGCRLRFYILVFLVYTIMVFGFGIYIGYVNGRCSGCIER